LKPTPYVLVVDDAPPIRSFLHRRLKHLGYRVKEASNAAEALDAMIAEPAAITTLDIRMPGQDGLWLAARIRDSWSKTAIIIASGADDPHLMERSRELGVVAYVTKPFDRELLRQAFGRAAKAAQG
jgi:CheY-like chemotaxis protein